MIFKIFTSVDVIALCSIEKVCRFGGNSLLRKVGNNYNVQLTRILPKIGCFVSPGPLYVPDVSVQSGTIGFIEEKKTT
jgi:hypothetical protein